MTGLRRDLAIGDDAGGTAAGPRFRRQRKGLLDMTGKVATLDVVKGYPANRFNAVKHGVLSQYVVLPWEDADAYSDLLDALVAEHGPEGPTETHLVEELAGIIWRKRRLRMAESAAHHHGPHDHDMVPPAAAKGKRAVRLVCKLHRAAGVAADVVPRSGAAAGDIRNLMDL